MEEEAHRGRSEYELRKEGDLSKPRINPQRGRGETEQRASKGRGKADPRAHQLPVDRYQLLQDTSGYKLRRVERFYLRVPLLWGIKKLGL